MTLFIRLLDVDVTAKAEILRDAVSKPSPQTFEVDPNLFAQVPGSPFAYWTTNRVLSLFKKMPALQRGDRIACAGAVTNDNLRFVRLNWEAKDRRSGMVPFAKGGKFSPFYSDVELLLNWKNDGRELKAFIGAFREAHGWSAHWAAELHNAQHYFRPGLTWPLRTLSGLGMRVMPAGCIFGHKGPAIFVENNNADILTSLLGIVTSTPFRFIVELHMTAASYEVGVIQRTPVPDLQSADTRALSGLVRQAWLFKRVLDSTNEVSHAFLLPRALRASSAKIDSFAIGAELAEIQRAIDNIAFRVYGLDGGDRKDIETWGVKTVRSNNSDEFGQSEDWNNDVSLHSWIIGVTFGRFDIRLATGERQAPPEPEPFDPLPARSPGMIPEADDAQFPARPLLVDDAGHALDLAAFAGDVLDRVGFPLENPEAFRRWLARDFFPLHIKMYSKSRRKAPIYWQLATPSASYSVWLYIHAFSRDALYQVQEIAGTKLLHEERKLETLRSSHGANPTAAQRKELENQETFVEELRAFLEEVKRVAPLWNPNLDDGVIINFAPLWRLVPHHKPWQKELKATWDALCAGEYDWAHLAMHLWPERVVPKCATDRSLAIAHDLEDVFWVEGEDGKWKPRPKPTRPVDELVRERTSPAVKAALQSLLEAPASPAGNGRGRPRRGRRIPGAPA